VRHRQGPQGEIYVSPELSHRFVGEALESAEDSERRFPRGDRAATAAITANTLARSRESRRRMLNSDPSRPQLNDRLKDALEGGQRHRNDSTIPWIKNANLAAVEIQDGISVEADDSSRYLETER
jgi:hypothetical protein